MTVQFPKGLVLAILHSTLPPGLKNEPSRFGDLTDWSSYRGV